MINIGIFSHEAGPRSGGVGRVVFDVYKELKSKSTYKPILFSKDSKLSYPYRNTIYQIFSSNYILYSVYINLILPRLIKYYRLDAAHFHVRSVFLWRKLNIPTVATVHHTYHQQYIITKRYIYKLLMHLEAYTFKCASVITADSESTRIDLLQNYKVSPNKVFVIPNGVDLKLFHKTNLKIKKYQLIYVGRLSSIRKGLDYLLESFSDLLIVDSRYTLVIVGSGPYKTTLMNKVRKLRIEGNVIFAGYMSDKRLVDLYSSSSMLILPTQLEGFGMVIIESMACNCPVISTNVPGVIDLITHNNTGLLVKYGDKRALIKSIVNLSRNSRLRLNIVNNSRQLIENNYSISKVTHTLSKLYKSILGNASATWDNFYSNEQKSLIEKVRHIIANYSLLYSILRKKHHIILEVGTGSGELAKFLSKFAKHTTSIDNNIELIKRCTSTNTNSKLLFKQIDAFDLPYNNKVFDIAYSQGFFEHFDDKSIIKLLEEQLRVSSKVVFTVPSNYYNCLDFGNERLLSVAQWKKILQKLNSNYSVKVQYCNYFNQKHLLKPTQILVNIF